MGLADIGGGLSDSMTGIGSSPLIKWIIILVLVIIFFVKMYDLFTNYGAMDKDPFGGRR